MFVLEAHATVGHSLVRKIRKNATECKRLRELQRGSGASVLPECDVQGDEEFLRWKTKIPNDRRGILQNLGLVAQTYGSEILPSEENLERSLHRKDFGAELVMFFELHPWNYAKHYDTVGHFEGENWMFDQKLRAARIGVGGAF